MLDGLRAIAVVAVIVHHANTTLFLGAKSPKNE
jgi:peptidoglycan/LPS O-acetylase OafA/YrhL